jgi:all-trans-retinol dehydrogenase (NAD+)
MAAAEISSAVASIIGLVKRAAFEPTLTGPLLLILTRGPERLRQPLQQLLLKPFAADRSEHNLVRVANIVKTLKWLFAFGLAARVNDILTAWAMNHWRVRKQGVPWNFDERTKKEIALITGGCSGFGQLVAQGLASKMRVVVLDMQDLPEDLKSCTLMSTNCSCADPS